MLQETNWLNIARDNGIKEKTYYWRVSHGWSKERAATKPTGKIAKIAREYGLNPSTVHSRIRYGWSLGEALKPVLDGAWKDTRIKEYPKLAVKYHNMLNRVNNNWDHYSDVSVCEEWSNDREDRLGIVNFFDHYLGSGQWTKEMEESDIVYQQHREWDDSTNNWHKEYSPSNCTILSEDEHARVHHIRR